MIPGIKLSRLQEEWLAWFNSHVWTMNTLSQFVVIALAFTLAAIISRLGAARITGAINDMRISAQFKRVLHNLRRLIMPLAAMTMLYLIRVLDTMGLLPIKTDIISAVMGLTIAWVVIRLALEVIENSFVRNIFAFAIWAVAALGILDVLDETIIAMDKIGIDIGKFRLSALSVTKGILALTFLLYMAMFLSSLAEKRIRLVRGLTASSRVLLGKTIRISLFAVALLIGVTLSGIDLSLLAVFSGAVGLGVGFGLQKVVSNLFSGMLLLLDRSITPGDIIELPNGAFGWVEHMGARYTEIVTRDNKSYLIPNEDFITQQVINWSHGDTLIRIEVKFGVHYDSDPHKVKALAEEAAKRPMRVVEEPPPVCHLAEFGENAMNFVLRFWIRDAQKGVTNMRGEVLLALWDAFQANGIRIPYPRREIITVEPINKTQKFA